MNLPSLTWLEKTQDRIDLVGGVMALVVLALGYLVAGWQGVALAAGVWFVGFLNGYWNACVRRYIEFVDAAEREASDGP